MADRTQSPRPSLFDDGRFVSVVACIVAIVVILVGGHLYGRYLASKEIGRPRQRDRAIAVASSAAEAHGRSEKRAVYRTAGQARPGPGCSSKQILPSKDTYNIVPNQTLIVADGRITVGLIGSPANESIVLNINGKQLAATAGQVIPAGSDASANCRVAVQSFDMFKAVLTATCAQAAVRE